MRPNMRWSDVDRELVSLSLTKWERVYPWLDALMLGVLILAGVGFWGWVGWLLGVFE